MAEPVAAPDRGRMTVLRGSMLVGRDGFVDYDAGRAFQSTTTSSQHSFRARSRRDAAIGKHSPDD